MAAPRDATQQASRRDAIMAAAVSVLAERGPRGLTHRAVDSAAGLGAGSVNYHAPTRAKLLRLALEEVLRRDIEVAARYFAVEEWSREVGVAAIAEFVIEMSSPANRERVIVRHHLRAESLTHPELRQAFDEQHDAFVQMIGDLFSTAGKPLSRARAELIRMSIDGMMSRRVLIGAVPVTDAEIYEMSGLIVGR